MRRVALVLAVAIVAIVAFVGGYVFSRSLTPDLPYARPTYTLSGSVAVPAFELPPSELASQEAKDLLTLRALVPMSGPDASQKIEETREGLRTLLSPLVSAMREAFPVDVAEETLAGVPVRIVTPAGRSADPKRVLINLHGGAFSMCWEPCSILESAPIASVGDYKVVSLNYRMAPEFRHPAAVEDVESVYRELLNDYGARSIGIYGCSAGGALTAQAEQPKMPMLLPQPGAIGIFGAGGVRFGAGDSAYVAAYIDGSFPPPGRPGDADLTHGYFDAAEVSGPIVSPALHLDMLSKFPPTLLITGTRAMDLSPAVYTNSQLVKVGVPTTMIVGEGMGHCYVYLSSLPEAQDAYRAIVAFFRANLE